MSLENFIEAEGTDTKALDVQLEDVSRVPVSIPQDGSSSSQEVTSIEFLEQGSKVVLFACTRQSVCSWRVWDGGSVVHQELRLLNVDATGGAAPMCACAFPGMNALLVAKPDAVFAYDPEEGNMSAMPLDGQKVILKRFQSYFVVVTSDTSAAPVSFTAGPASMPKQTVTVVLAQKQMRFIAFTSQFTDVTHVVKALGKIYLVSRGGADGNTVLFELQEKPLSERLDVLVKKRMFEWAAEVALTSNGAPEVTAEIYRQHGDALFEKRAYDQALQIYAKTVDLGLPLEPSYVVERYLDAQRRGTIFAMERLKEESEASSEALEMLRSLLVTHLGKRSKSDLLSIMADPSLPFRLYPEHQRRYEDFLSAFEVVDPELAIESGQGHPEHITTEEPMFGGRNPLRRLVLDRPQGFLPRAALAAVFARAAYGALMRKGAGDRVSGFLGGAAKSYAGTWEDEDHTEAFVELTGAKREDILVAHWSLGGCLGLVFGKKTEKPFEPAFVIFWVHRMSWLVLAVRGSCEWSAVLTDMAAEESLLAGGLAHSGMARAARWILSSAGAAMAEGLAQRPSYRLVCTGHSLGADVAQLVAIMLREGDTSTTDIPKCLGPRSEMEALDSFLNVEPVDRGYIVGSAKAAAPEFPQAMIVSPELAARCSSYVLSVALDADYITRVARAFGASSQVAEVLCTPGRLLHMDCRGVGLTAHPVKLFWSLPSFYHETWEKSVMQRTTPPSQYDHATAIEVLESASYYGLASEVARKVGRFDDFVRISLEQNLGVAVRLGESSFSGVVL
eukprot:g25052.t2